MKANRLALARFATLALFTWVNSVCVSSLGQGNPLNSWNQVFSGPVPITSMAYGNGTFVGVGGGLRFISFNGSNWTAYATPPIINNGGIGFGKGMFLMFGTNSQFKANYVLESTNGMAWTTIYTSSNTLVSAAYGNNTWVFIGTNDIATATLILQTGTGSEFQPGFSPSCITYGNGMFVIGGYIGNFYSIFSSFDGIAWQYDANVNVLSYMPFSPRPLNGIAYGDGVFVASFVFLSSSSYYGFAVEDSTDLVNWSDEQAVGGVPNQTYVPVAFGGNRFITTLGANWYYTSSDGHSWLRAGGLNGATINASLADKVGKIIGFRQAS